MTVDAHHHVWDLSVRDQDWIDPTTMAVIRRSFGVADLAGPAQEADVTATVLVQTVAVAAETPEFLAIAAAPENTLVAGVVGWVDLTDPGVGDALAALRGLPGGDRLVGIRHLVQGESDPRWLTRPDVRRGLRAVADAGLVYDLLTLPHQLPAAVETVRALPDLRFVLDHLSKPLIASGVLQPWADDLRALAEAPNVAAKLSGLVTEADAERWTVADLRPYADVALDAFGPERLMFGSDWPVCLLAGSYADVAGAARELTDQLSPAEREQIFDTTARHWYHLTDPKD
ncbi:MAG TPA: amidohydrolase family protein [Micromonosporaceae bacterium]|nr:amidohydrolase family protein [Micromonosporaceae bacterium]